MLDEIGCQQTVFFYFTMNTSPTCSFTLCRPTCTSRLLPTSVGYGHLIALLFEVGPITEHIILRLHC